VFGVQSGNDRFVLLALGGVVCAFTFAHIGLRLLLS
jgi:hypothetical protein